VRRVHLGLMVLLVATGCQRSFGTGPAVEPAPIRVSASSAPYSEVTAGQVRASIPHDWRPIQAADGPSEGFIASPQPNAWRGMDGSVAGMAATWVDASQVGVPSDYYYLAATGPVLASLTGSDACDGRQRVLVDNRPAWMAGAAASPGDYLARGEGTCLVDGTPTRWAYFVAAPGFGPERRLGIPAAGLYVVVAVLPDSRQAPRLLRTLLLETRFGNAGIRDFVSMARNQT
jgi:hypothetical protein